MTKLKGLLVYKAATQHTHIDDDMTVEAFENCKLQLNKYQTDLYLLELSH
jgi:hypothetical protein